MDVAVEKQALEIIKAVVERKSHPAVEVQASLIYIVCHSAPGTGAESSDLPQRSEDLRDVVARLMRTRTEYERLPFRESDGALVYRRRR